MKTFEVWNNNQVIRTFVVDAAGIVEGEPPEALKQSIDEEKHSGRSVEAYITRFAQNVSNRVSLNQHGSGILEVTVEPQRQQYT